ncbi:MAG: hypothetical protein CM15mP127_02720 [Gammaproteobacteria bacterium]|nr:MAG: hypothetical protein CM15mP127_02720 [Gammaproteobacteria bacterium]
MTHYSEKKEYLMVIGSTLRDAKEHHEYMHPSGYIAQFLIRVLIKEGMIIPLI